MTPTSTTAAASTASITAAAASALLTSLDTGSGVDTASLVSSLVTAQFAAKNAALTSRYDTLTAQISGAGTLKNTITDFTAALSGLVKGGTLASQPLVSNGNVLSATAIPGAKLAGMTASVTVTQLAGAQTAVSATAFASSSTVVGTGKLTLTFGNASYATDGSMASFVAGSAVPVEIDITDANSSLSGIAAAINAKKAGVTAAVVTDADGTAYLSLKGATGAAQAFTLDTTSTSGDLARLAVGPGGGMTISAPAKNARLVVDGVAVERGSNEISDLVTGVKLNLLSTSASAVSLSATTPKTGLTAAVNDLVETYNQVLGLVKAQTDPITGVLRADPAAKTLLRSLQSLVSQTLLPNAESDTPATLAGIGVRTNRDGTLAVDDDALAAAMTNYPDAIEAMFAFSTTSATGLYAAMNSLSLAATSTLYGLGASTTTYADAQTAIAAQQSEITDKSTALSTRLTQQYASMNAKVAAYKSTQAFLKQQIDAWSNSNA